MISVVIPLYNKERYIARAIQSVLNQTYSKTELIVVNDGSTDRSVDIAQEYSDQRIRFIHQPNAGLSAARNRGINEAHTELIAFLDADDEWTSHHLENAARVLGGFPELGWYSCAFRREGNRSKLGHVKRFRGRLKEGAIIEDYFSAAAIPNNNLVNSDTVVVRRKLLLSLGGFREELLRGEDRLMWFRLGMIEPQLGYSRAVGAIYHSTEGSLTSRDDIKDPGGFIGYLVSAMKEERNIPISQSCISFLNRLVNGEINYCFMKKDLTSLSIIKNECGELISGKNALLIRIGLFSPNLMKVKAILTNLLQRQKKRIIGVLIRIRRLLYGSLNYRWSSFRTPSNWLVTHHSPDRNSLTLDEVFPKNNPG